MDPKSRSWLGALAEAVKAMCLVLINLMSATNKGVAMLDAAVTNAQENQTAELAASKAANVQRVRDQAALEKLRSQNEIDEFVKANPTKAEDMAQAQKEIGELIMAELAQLRAKK